MTVDITDFEDVVHPLLPPLHVVQSFQELEILEFEVLEVLVHLVLEGHAILGQDLLRDFGDLLPDSGDLVAYLVEFCSKLVVLLFEASNLDRGMSLQS